MTMNTIDKTAIAAVRYYAAQSGLLCHNRNFVVVDTLEADLNISLVGADNTTYSCKASKTVASLGVGPLTRVIAEKIVGTVNMSARIIPPDNTAEIQSEVKRHYALSQKVIAYMQANPDKDTLKMATVFACAPQNKQPVVLSIPEVRQMASSYARQYANLVEEFINLQGIRLLDIEKIILVGNTLGSPVVKPEIMRLGDTKVVAYTNQDAEKFDYSDPQPSSAPAAAIGDFFGGGTNDESTQFQMAGSAPAPAPSSAPAPPAPAKPERVFIQQYREVMSVSLSSLPQGTCLRIDTFDPTPGKGAAFQELESLGNGLFKIISSGRQLAPGDVCKPYSPSWTPGVQVDLDITRSGKPLGRFRTRIVKRISVKNCYEDALGLGN